MKATQTMLNMTEEELTQVVLNRYENTPDVRLREILHSLIRHAHAFVRDVRLTEDEWLKGVLYLTSVGQICDDKRQEMILLSDNLGISMLVNLISANVAEGATESTVVGPFYVPDTEEKAWGESIQQLETDEMPMQVCGSVVDLEGNGIPHAKMEVWQTNTNGMYDIQDDQQPVNNLRGWYRANEQGQFLIRTVRPVCYSIPTDGPVGVLLAATDRHPWRPAHLHVKITAPGYKTLITHIFDEDDPYLDSDVVFAVKHSLTRKFERIESAVQDSQNDLPAPYFELRNDFVLEPLEQH